MKFLLGILLLSASLAATAEPLDVLVTILPHASLVERLGGESVQVRVLVGPGETPASFDPTPRQLQALAGSRLWLTTGAPLETPLAPRLAALQPDLDIVATHAGLELLAEAACTDHHHDHDHGETDPHVWLSARNTSHQVAIMADALARHLPGESAAIAARLDTLQAELQVLDQELADLLAPVRGRTFVVFHPAFGYLARDYELVQQAVESGGLAPSPRHLSRLLAEIQSQGIHTIFVQPQQSDQLVQRLAREADLAVVVLDPLARDHLANLRHIGIVLRAGMESQP